MQDTEVKELLKLIDDTIAATTAGKVMWHKPNSSTFAFQPTGGAPSLTIQSVRANATATPVITFQVNSGSNEVLIQVNTNNSNFRDKLVQLFNTAQRQCDQIGINAFKKILPGH